jgi:hypothetical protein
MRKWTPNAINKVPPTIRAMTLNMHFLTSGAIRAGKLKKFDILIQNRISLSFASQPTRTIKVIILARFLD